MSFITSASPSLGAFSTQTRTLSASASGPFITFFLPAPTITLLPAPTTTTTLTQTSQTITAVFSSNFISSNFISTTTATSQPNSAETSTAAELATTVGLTRTNIIISIVLGSLTLIAIIVLLIFALILLRRRKRRESIRSTEPKRRPSPVYLRPPELAYLPPGQAVTTPGGTAVVGSGQLRRQVSGPLYHKTLQQAAAQERERIEYEAARDNGRPAVRVQRVERISDSDPDRDRSSGEPGAVGVRIGIARRASLPRRGSRTQSEEARDGSRTSTGLSEAPGGGMMHHGFDGGQSLRPPGGNSGDPSSRRASSGIFPRPPVGMGFGSGEAAGSGSPRGGSRTPEVGSPRYGIFPRAREPGSGSSSSGRGTEAGPSSAGRGKERRSPG